MLAKGRWDLIGHLKGETNKKRKRKQINKVKDKEIKRTVKCLCC
jgi:hypothetical protein